LQAKNTAHDFESLLVYSGGAPANKISINKSIAEQNWTIPDDLKLFYQVHNGFGQIASLTSSYYFDGQYRFGDLIADSESISTFRDWYPDFTEDNEYEIDEDNEETYLNPLRQLKVETNYEDSSYTNQYGDVPLDNLLCIMEFNGDCLAFARKIKTQTDCPALYYFHDTGQSELYSFFYEMDRFLTQSWRQSFFSELNHLDVGEVTQDKLQNFTQIAYEYRSGLRYALDYEQVFNVYYTIINIENTNTKNAEDLYTLAYMYNNGIGTDSDETKAVKYYDLSATKGYAHAQYALADHYWYNDEKYKKAIKWYQLAAKQNHQFAASRLGSIYEDGDEISRDYSKAAYYYKIAADLNCTESQYQLANLYDTGKGIEQSSKRSFHYYQLSANKQNSCAQYAVAYMYHYAEHVPQSYQDAFEWYLKAAEQEHLAAQFQVGNFLFKGIGTKQSYAAAAKWFELAYLNNTEYDEEEEEDEDEDEE